MLPPRGGRERGHGGGERQVVGPPRVHPAQQRVHQPVGHLVAQPPPHERPDGDVLAGGQDRTAAVAVQLRRHVRQPVKGGRLSGYPHQGPGWDGPQLAGERHGGTQRARVHELVAQPDGLREAHRGARPAVRIADQELLGRRLGGDPGQVHRAQLAAQLPGLLDQHDLGAVLREPVRRGEPADPPAHDHGPHPLSPPP